MTNAACIELFEKYLTVERRASDNTVSSYLGDIRQLAAYLDEHNGHLLHQASEAELMDYISLLRSSGRSVATVSRSITSIKKLYTLLFIRDHISHNPSLGLCPEKRMQKIAEGLCAEELSLLLRQPDSSSPKGCRDRAMLELLCTENMHINDIINLNLEDVDLARSVLNIPGKKSALRSAVPPPER